MPETNPAFRAMPQMTDTRIFQMFGLLRGNEIIATLNAGHSEH